MHDLAYIVRRNDIISRDKAMDDRRRIEVLEGDWKKQRTALVSIRMLLDSEPRNRTAVEQRTADIIANVLD